MSCGLRPFWDSCRHLSIVPFAMGMRILILCSLCTMYEDLELCHGRAHGNGM
jgi:hypothetical protein